MIASIGFDRRIVITSLKQKIILYSHDLKLYAMELVFHKPSNKLFIRTFDYQVFELDMNVKLKKLEQKIHHSSKVNCLSKIPKSGIKTPKVVNKEVFHSSEFHLHIMR